MPADITRSSRDKADAPAEDESSGPGNVAEPRTYTWRSLSVRYVGLILLVVTGTGMLLGAGETLVSVRQAARERERSLRYAASVIAASTIPTIADEEREAISGRLTSLLEAAQVHDIECIAVFDAQGNLIAETDEGCTCGETSASSGMIDVFTKPQVIEVPVEVDGLTVGSVEVQFRPVGLEEAVYSPLRITVLVLVLTMIIASLWGGWMVLRTVVEPIGVLRDAASRIADGERDVRLVHERRDEIGELASALDQMTGQLQRQERELRESYSSLEEAFDEKADLALRLRRTMGMKSDFVATASHEIRSPLAVIQLYAEMLEDNEYGDIDPELAETIDSIVLAVSRLSAIVQNLLDVALLERGLMSLEYADTALRDVVEQAVVDAAALAARNSITVEIAGEVPDIYMRADQIRLRQAVDNLLSNAVKYSPPGGRVDVGVRSDAASVFIDVADSGSGIPPERADVLFELFGRADTGDNATVPGLGLGLPIADRIVRAHGGSIVFESKPDGGGTVFTIQIPREGADVARAPSSVEIVQE